MKLRKILKISIILVLTISISFYLCILSQTGSSGEESSFQGTFIGIERNSKDINGAHKFKTLIPTTFYKDAILIKTSDGDVRSIPLSSKSKAFKKTSENHRIEISFFDIPKGARVTG